MNNDIVNQIVEQFLSKAPALRPFLTQEKNVEFVSKSLMEYNPNPVHLERQGLYKNLIISNLKKIFSKAEFEKMKLFHKNPGVIGNTVDHLGFLNHPHMTSGYMTMGFSSIFGDERDVDDLLILSTSAIPLNDYFHKRGFEFNGKHINVTSKGDRNKLLYLCPKMEINIIEKLRQGKELGKFSKSEVEFLEKIDKIIEGIDFSKCEKYADQLTKINFYLWPLLLPEAIRDKAPNLLTVEVEQVELNYLLELIKNKESFIYDVLFDEQKRNLVLELFDGATGAWSKANNTGTYFFWQTSNGFLEKLVLREGNLVNEKNNFSVSLDPDEISEALRNGTIFPAMLLTYAISVFYCGIKSLAGMGSTQYVTDLKNRWIKYFEKINSPEIELIKTVDTLSYTNSSMNISRKDNDLKEDWAFDLMYQNGKDISYYKKINQLPYKYLQYPIVSEFYGYYVKGDEMVEFDKKEFFKQFDWIE